VLDLGPQPFYFFDAQLFDVGDHLVIHFGAVTASFKIPRLASINVSQSRVQVMQV
tara:strand:+ start:329 stop:493 length:165 start_codon:yes stop_codon:yes gene_type:complete